jgi:hypothetical protein
MYWSNHYGVLNRAHLDVCWTVGPLSDAANPLSCLAKMFNDYSEFQPQNLMIKYVNDFATELPKKKNPYDEAWIKSTWNDVCKYLHQVFIQYNRSGQHSGDIGEWCSPKEQ